MNDRAVVTAAGIVRIAGKIEKQSQQEETEMNDYAVVTAPGTVRIERLLPGPIGRIWSYLTESDKRSQWLAAGNMELKDRWPRRVRLPQFRADQERRSRAGKICRAGR